MYYQQHRSNKARIETGDSPAIDAFGRLRVSNPKTIFDSKQIFSDPDILTSAEKYPLFYDNQQVSGSGTATLYEINRARTVLSVSANTIGRRVRQSKQCFNYQPGKSMMILNTFNFPSGGGEGIVRREGYYNDNNGLFFEDNQGVLRMVTRTYVSGAVVDNAVEQADWNIDTLDGNGASGIDLDFSKTQILFIDMEWLGVGRVRMGFVVDGLIYIAHEFLNTNELDYVYMSTPNLPLRSEIINDGNGDAASMSQICSTVISEGGQDETGIIRSASTDGTHIDCTTENIWYAIIGIKLKAAYIGETVKIIEVALQEHAGSKKMEWALFFNPIVADTFTYNSEANSAIEVARGATANTVTEGTRIQGGYFESGGVQSGNVGSISNNTENALLLGATIAGVTDSIVLCAKPIAGSTNADVEGSITWRELT